MDVRAFDRFPWWEEDDWALGSPDQRPHQVWVPLDLERAGPDLFVLLHGKWGNPESYVQNLADGYSAACNRVISLQWHARGTTANECEEQFAAAAATIPQWNDCLESVREDRMTNEVYGIEIQLAVLLWQLEVLYPTEGWGQYLRDDGWPRWSRIVITGFSEGANMTGYITHREPVPGAILIGGGGDRNTQEEPADIANVDQARWMSPALPANPRVVGMYNEEEPFGGQFYEGWQQHGLIPGVSGDAKAQPPYYASFGGANHLVRSGDNFADPNLPHVSTTWPELRPAHMYLACRAAGRPTTWIP